MCFLSFKSLTVALVGQQPLAGLPALIAIVVGISVADAQEPPAQIKPRIQNGWTELPKWAENGLPFDARSYYAIDESDNREPLYLEAFLEFDYSEGMSFFPGIEHTPEHETWRKADKVRREKAPEFLDRNVDEHGYMRIGPENQQEAKDILTRYESAFEKLEAVYERRHCFFHCQIDTNSLNTQHYLARRVAQLLGIRCQLDLESGRAVRNVRMGLELKRDLQRLGEYFGQLADYRIESYCFAWMVRPILESENLTHDQLNELIVVLVDHYDEQKRLDPFIESSRFEYLMFRNLFRQLQSGEYAANLEQRCADLGLKETLSVPGLIIVELVSFVPVYGINSTVLDEEISALAKNNSAIAKAAKKLAEAKRKTDEKDEMEKLLNRDNSEQTILAPFLLNALASMTAVDYDNEISVLDKRYKQIESACAMPYPNSTDELKMLATNWTTDDTWKKTKILKWFQPNIQLIISLRRKSTLGTNAYVCLAAAIKWQREHDNNPPENLGDALNAIGIEEIPIDPFSGNPLKMTLIDNKVVVYSVGPDGDDDHAERRTDIFGGSPSNPNTIPDGDVVFQLDYLAKK